MTRNSKGDEWVAESGKEYNDRLRKEAEGRQLADAIERAKAMTNQTETEAPKLVLWRTE